MLRSIKCVKIVQSVYKDVNISEEACDKNAATFLNCMEVCVYYSIELCKSTHKGSSTVTYY